MGLLVQKCHPLHLGSSVKWENVWEMCLKRAISLIRLLKLEKRSNVQESGTDLILQLDIKPLVVGFLNLMQDQQGHSSLEARSLRLERSKVSLAL